MIFRLKKYTKTQGRITKMYPQKEHQKTKTKNLSRERREEMTLESLKKKKKKIRQTSEE